MRMFLIALTTSVVALGFAGIGEADTVLFSPMLRAPADGGFYCSAVNISNQRRTVRVLACDSTGACLGGSNLRVLDPGDVASLTVSRLDTSPATSYCKVMVDGLKTTLRAALSVFDAADVTTITVPLE